MRCRTDENVSEINYKLMYGERKDMRRFIYLDTDTLNSYLAQIFDGLIQNQQTEKSVASRKEGHNRYKGGLSAQIALKLFGKGVDAKAETEYEYLKTAVNDEMVKDVQTKIMHDNAFNEFVSYLKNNNQLKGREIGNFISIEDEFYIFDIAFYQKLFEENGFISCLKDIQRENFQNQTTQQVQELTREQRREKGLQKKVQETIESATEKNEKEFNSAQKLISMLASIIPYPQIMCISNYVVVLNDDYLRDDLKTASFKYGGKIKVVGYITNKVTAQGNPAISTFAGIGNSINALLKMFFENADEMYIVHPIAIYYDN